MSVTIAHRPHVQVPWLQIVVILAIAAVAALAVVLAVELTTAPPQQATSAQAVGTGAAGASVSAAVMAKNRSPVVRAIMSGEAPVTTPAQPPASTLKWARTPWAAGEGR